MMADAKNVTGAKISFNAPGTGTSDYPAKFNKPADKKYIAIINHYTSGNLLLNNNTGATASNYDAKHIDYLLYVKAGTATPVFKRTNPADPTTSVLQGFVLKADTQGYIPKYNGATLPSTTVFEGTYLIAGEEFTASKSNPLRIYNLTSLENGAARQSDGTYNGSNEIKTIEFVKDHIKTDKLWIKYGGTGDGSNPAEPAPSYAYLANNIISQYYTADDTVNVYVMQDDTEIYYNSTMYGNLIGDPTYTPEYIGNFADTEGGTATHHTPESHFTAVNDKDNALATAHTAKVVIQSYDDGDGDKNFYAFRYQLGLNNSVMLAGPTEFKNIILLSTRGWKTSIAASGYDLTYNDDVEFQGLLVDEYADKKQWDGTFKIYDNITAITGDDYNYRWEYGDTFWGDGGNIVLNSSFKVGVALGSNTGKKQFDNPINIYFNAAATHPVSAVGKNRTFKSINFIINNPKADISFTVPTAEGLTVTDGIQYIIDSKASLKNADEFFAKFTNNGGVWKLTVNNSKGNFLDVTDTVGTFKVAEGFEAVAFNSDTNTYKRSENGYLTLEAGNWEVASADEGNIYAVLDKKFIALSDGTVDLKADDLSDLSTISETGKTFIGWTYEDSTKPTMDGSTITVKEGELLVAAYAEVDTKQKLSAEGIQIRNKGEQGLRFVFRKYASLEETLKGAGVTFKPDTEVHYGVLISPTKDTLGKDMLIDDGISTKVMGINTFATGENSENGKYTEYTVVVDNMTAAKFVRNYSAQGYIEYTDINGIEREAYSDYMQTNHYNAALLAEEQFAGTETMTAELSEMIADVKTYAEQTRRENYNNTYIAEQTDITNTLGLAGLDAGTNINPYSDAFKIYTLKNGFKYIDINLDWYYVDTTLADSTATELVQQTDHHLNYFSYKDFIDNRKIVEKAYTELTLNKDGASAKNTIRAMEFSSWANKVILTGDMMNSPTLGSMQLVSRLIKNTDLNKENILTVLGENDISYNGVSVEDDKDEAYYRSLIKTSDIWSGSNLDYQAVIVKNDNGKNPVYVVTMNNSAGYYTTEQVTQFKATVSEAVKSGIPIIVYQHKPVAPNDGTNTIFYVGGKKGESLGITEGFAASENKNEAMYELFTVNADTILGIFCGHDHSLAYTEIKGSGRSEGATIPQLIAPATYLDNGWAVKANLTAKEEADTYTANMTGFDESNVVLAFAALTDTHFEGSGTAETTSYQNFADAVNITSANSAKPLDLVTVSGDLTGPTWGHRVGAESSISELRSRANLLNAVNDNLKDKGIGFLSSYGNHDTGIYAANPNPLSTEGFSQLYMDDVFAKTDADADYFFGKDIGYSAENRDATLKDAQVLRGNRHVVYTGSDGTQFHFLTLAELRADNHQNDLDWLDNKLKELTSSEKKQTIFVLSHYRPSGLTFISGQDNESSVSTKLKRVLQKYPQVITFGGHSHTFVELENSIMQDTNGFISVDCGTLTGHELAGLIGDNLGTGTKNCNTTHPDVTRHCGLLTEVDKNGNIRISRYDFRYNRKVGNDWIIPAVKSDGSRDLLYTKDRGNTDAPTFTVGNLTAEREDTTLTVTFPKAVSKTQVVQSYALTVTEQGSNTPINFTYVPVSNKSTTKETSTAYITSDFYKQTKFTMPSRYTETFVIGQTTDTTGKYTINLAADKSYIVKVIARDSWGNQSVALETTLAATN